MKPDISLKNMCTRMIWDSYCPTLSAFISHTCVFVAKMWNYMYLILSDKYNWHLRQKKPWFIKLYSVPSLKKTLILKKSLPLAQEGQKRSCTSQGHCVENQSHCWRIQTSQVWQLKTTTYNYAIHTNILIHVNPISRYANLDKQFI